MPPAQLRVPVILFLLGEPTDDQYSTIRNILYCFIVSIGYYHLWYYDIPDRERIRTIIFRIVRSVLNNIPDPGPNVAMPREFFLRVYQIFISCMKHILSNQRLMWDNYLREYDRCVQGCQDTYTCHHRGVYAGNTVWGMIAIAITGILWLLLSPVFQLSLPLPYMQYVSDWVDLYEK